MVPHRFTTPRLLATLSALAVCAAPAMAATLPSPQSAADSFYRAYYLEHEKGDLDAAMKLYKKAIKSGKLSAAERAKIESHLRACAEELAMDDLAQLVPADTIVYAELNDPGTQLERLLNQLGLLQGTDRAGDIAISPHLINGILGLKGAALAVTRVDPTAGMPGGVLILHPGDMEAVRGLIETALPAGGQEAEPIAGQRTFIVEGMVHVTMGERLIVASTERQLIEDVMRRVTGDRTDSLAANEDLAETLAGHGDDLLYFCANAEPVMPLIEGALGAVASQDPEAAMAIQLLDPTSLQTISGSIGVDEAGLSMDMGLTLEEGHKNLAFNLMRMPHVSESTFELIPNGVAGFVASSLNEHNPGGTGVTDASGAPVVTIMDLGREVFGNLVNVALFALPSISEGPGGMPIPDAALAMSVNDPERSKAIWRLVLGMAQGATSGNGRMTSSSVGAHKDGVERFQIEGVDVFLFSQGDRLVISPSKRAIEAAVGAAGGANLTRDELFAGLAQQASKDHTSVFGVSMGRIADLAAQVIPAHELEEVGPFLALLSDTAIVATTRHSDTDLRWSAKVSGLPNVGPMVAQLIHEEMHGGSFQRGTFAASAARKHDHGVAVMTQPLALAAADSQHEHSYDAPKPAAGVKSHFKSFLASGNTEAASALLPIVATEIGDNPNDVNQFVWDLISSKHGDALAPALLPIISAANDATKKSNWYILDTMAHVQFAAGDAQGAISTSRRAVKVAHKQKDSRAKEAEAALARFVKSAKTEMLR